MIPEVDRYQGVVLRQMLMQCGRPVKLGVADLAGRVDAFFVEGAAFQIKHSSKRMSPWRFTYQPENLRELEELKRTYAPVWAVLVCGTDGVVGLSSSELKAIAAPDQGGAAWIRVTRDRRSMYRVGGAGGDLSYAKPQGVEQFLTEVFPDMGLVTE